MNKATIQLDSINEFGNRLTTPILDFPRIVLAEFNTHKMISKNSASSRAIPFAKMLQMVKDNPFIPIRWMKDHSGMQGTEYVTDQKVIDLRKGQWLNARNKAVASAEELAGQITTWESIKDFYPTPDGEGITKQVVNRLLEPFMWHKVLASATEWDNFLALRAAEGAEIHIQQLAYLLMEAMNASSPNIVKAGEWHIPFGENIDTERLSHRLQIATARCARTSYNNFDGNSNPDKDIELHNNLVKGGHWSPMEHICRAMDEREFHSWTKMIRVKKGHDLDHYHANNNPDWYEVISYSEDGYANIVEYGWCANMRGWIPYRKLFSNENRVEPRLVKHYTI